MKKLKAAPKRAEKTRMAAPKCATEKMFRHSSTTKSIDVIYRTTDSRTTVELTELRPEASSGKRNERHYEKAHGFTKKNCESEV